MMDTAQRPETGAIDYRDVSKHSEILESHAMQLELHAKSIRDLQDNGIRMENLVMTENKETRQTVTKTNDLLREVIKGLMGYNTENNERSHKLTMAQLESVVKILSLLAGSGGILWYVFAK